MALPEERTVDNELSTPRASREGRINRIMISEEIKERQRFIGFLSPFKQAHSFFAGQWLHNYPFMPSGGR